MTISFGATLQHDQITEGYNISMECHVLANPAVTEIGWVFDGHLLTSGDNENIFNTSSGYVHIKHNSMFIYNVNRRHSGLYRCIAANSQGDGRSDDILLHVQC